MLRTVRLFSRQLSPNILRRYRYLFPSFNSIIFVSILRLRHTDNSSNNIKSSSTSLGRDSTVSSVYNFPALSKSPSGLGSVKYALPESNRYETHVTKLDNGLRVRIDRSFPTEMMNCLS